MKSTFFVIVFSLFFHYCYSQRAVSNQSDNCHPDPITYSDTLTQRVAVDSMMNLLIGEWELIEVARGWSKNFKPSVFSKIIFSKTGYTEYWEDEVIVSSCYVDIVLRLGYFRYKIRQLQGKKFIRLTPKSLGNLVLCERRLIISNSKGDGESLMFKRLPVPKK